jgi:hypothetical protein
LTKKNIYIIVILFLFLSVPWFFFDINPGKYFGLPDWGFYSFVLSILFAITVAILISKYWDKLSGGKDEDE